MQTIIPKLKTVLRLTHVDRFTTISIITTLLGAASAKGWLDWKLLVVLSANWLCVASLFAAKDLINAPEDALGDPFDCDNPIAQGSISPQYANVILWISLLAGILLFTVLGLFGSAGWMPLILGVIGSVMGHSVIHRAYRYKKSSLSDFILQAALFTSFQVLSGYFAFKGFLNTPVLFSLLTIACLSIYHTLSTAINNPEDRWFALPTQILNPKNQRRIHFLMVVCLSIGLISGFILIVFMRTVTVEIVILMGVLAVIFSLPLIKKISNKVQYVEIQKPLYKALTLATTIALSMQFLMPFILQFFR